MIEVFTSSTCGPCNPGNTALNNVLSNFAGEYTLLKYQMNWPGSGDPYYTSEGGSRKSYYSVNSVPNMQVDGGYNGNPSSFTSQLFQQYSSAPSYTSIEAIFSVTGQTVDISITVDPNENRTGLKLYTAIFEHNTFLNVKSNGETEFENVMKKLLPGGFQGGQYISSLDSGVQQNFDFSYTFNGSYTLPSDAQNQINHNVNHSVEDFNNLGVAVWIQDNSNKEILQSTTASYGTSNINNPLSSKLEFMLLPNPAADFTIIALKGKKYENIDVTVTNLLGEVVIIDQFNPENSISKHSLNLSSLSKGIYNVALSSRNYFSSKKVVVTK
jgi:predicted 3-demethylubiquinone-9 3-methyltransferase (glyoxalase superfamily)